MSIRGKWIFVLILAGLMVSLYLTLKAHNPDTVICSIGGGCETVLTSRYATLFGLPVAAWGLIWYGAGLGLAYLTFAKRRYPWFYFLLWSLGGLFVSVYLLGLEAFKIHAYCTWCLVSLLVVALIFVLTLAAKKDFSPKELV